MGRHYNIFTYRVRALDLVGSRESSVLSRRKRGIALHCDVAVPAARCG